MPCNNEEADTRVLLHIKNQSEAWAWCADNSNGRYWCSYNCDLLLDAKELWVDFGVGKNKRLLPIHKYAVDLRNRNARHCYFGMPSQDVILCHHFQVKGNLLAGTPGWKSWRNYINHCKVSRDIDKSDICRLERFTVLLYDRSSSLEDVGCLQRREDRLIQCHQQEMHSFNTFGEQPIKLASLHSSFRLKSTFQFSITVTSKNASAPGYSEMGLENEINGPEEPLRMTQSEAEKNLRKLILCNCPNGCNARCTCQKSDLPWTELCLCNGQCN